MDQSTRKSEYNTWFPTWEKVRDAAEGQERIHEKKEKYLPKLKGQKNYEGYLARAVYYNYTGRTIETSLGHLFRKDPIVEGVDDIYQKNIDLSGSSFNYFFRDVAEEVMKVNRVGVMLDYSEGSSRPYLIKFRTESIIKWRTKIIKGVEKLSFVMLEGEREVINIDDKYKESTEKVWKELFLDENGIYQVQDWKKDNAGVFVEDGDQRTPMMNDKTLDFIPFYMITSAGITTKLSKSVMVGFVDINLGHYVNSADFENMLHWTGQKTVVTVGFGSGTVPIGGSMDLENEGQAFFLEASSDSGLKDEMKHKEDSMAAVGSQILSGKGRYVASAETSRITSEGEYASLADISNSLTDSAQIIMEQFNLWARSTKDVKIEFNTDFDVQGMPPGRLVELQGAVQAGNMSQEVYFYNLSVYETYPPGWTFENEKAAIEESMANQVKNRDNENGFDGDL